MGGAALIVVAGLLTALPPSIPAAFGMMGGVLTGAALLLPWVLLGLVGMMERLGSGVLWTWFWADTRQQLPGLSLALMALLLALAANVGVTTMVSSFRLTFVGFLDQRLAAEMYVNAAGEDGLEDWLAQRADALLPIQSANRTVAGQAAKIYGTRDHSTYPDNWRMLQATASPWADLHSGTAALINEQLARRAGLGIGDQIEVESRLFAVAGIFGDYGNPVGQVMLDEQVWHDLFPRDPARQFAVRVAADKVAALRTDTIAAFDLSPESVVDQATVKSISLAIFERTFVVTGALNVLTLLVAAFALFMSLLTLSDMRLPQVAPVWALGLTRRSLGWVEAARALGLAALTAVLALPLGLGLAWILLAVVNVQAFGWKLPMFLFPRDYALLGVEALAVAAIAAVWPSLRLSRQPASKLLGIFASER